MSFLAQKPGSGSLNPVSGSWTGASKKGISAPTNQVSRKLNRWYFRKTAKGTPRKSRAPRIKASSIRTKGIRSIQLRGSDSREEKRKYRIPSVTRKTSPRVSITIPKRKTVRMAIPIPSKNLVNQ